MEKLTKTDAEIMLKHLENHLDEIKKERQKLSDTVKNLLEHRAFEDDAQKGTLEQFKADVDEHSKIAVEHLKMLEAHLEETKAQYIILLNENL